MTTIKDKDMLTENTIRPNEGENFFVSYSDDSKHSNRVEELKDFVLALENKIDLAKNHNKDCLVKAFEKIKADAEKWVIKFESSGVSFHEAYEEVTSLYVFAEMYLTVDEED